MNNTLLATGIAANAVTTVRTGPVKMAAPAGAIHIEPGDSIQAIVKAAAPGASFFLEAGTYRLQSIVPKDGQKFFGEDGAILSGARLLTNFQKDGSGWVIGGQTQEGARRALDEAVDGFARAGYPETVFVDNKPLKPVAKLADLTKGTFYFDYAADKIHIADNPAGHKIEAGAAAYAFSGNAKNVVVQNLTVEKYSNPVQHGAIGGGGAPEGWIIKNNEIRLNFGVGATVGTNSQLVSNYVHDNGEMGLGGNGNSIKVRGNEIASNGYFSGIDPMWEGGGTKFAQTKGLQVVGNYSHDNNGFGLWTDIDNISTLYQNNRVEYNSHGGINHEISYFAIIRGNTFVGNGSGASGWMWGSAIQLQNSKNVQVYDNAIDLTGSGNAIGLIQQDRGTGVYGAHTTTGNYIHDNAMYSSTAASGAFGAVADANEAGMLRGNNRFDYNKYFVVDVVDDRWNWGDAYNWKDYRAASGQDAHSTVKLVREAPPAPHDVAPLSSAASAAPPMAGGEHLGFDFSAGLAGQTIGGFSLFDDRPTDLHPLSSAMPASDQDVLHATANTGIGMLNNLGLDDAVLGQIEAHHLIDQGSLLI